MLHPARSLFPQLGQQLYSYKSQFLSDFLLSHDLQFLHTRIFLCVIWEFHPVLPVCPVVFLNRHHVSEFRIAHLACVSASKLTFIVTTLTLKLYVLFASYLFGRSVLCSAWKACCRRFLWFKYCHICQVADHFHHMVQPCLLNLLTSRT